MPTAWVMDPAREPMIALKMNDEPLPPIHGYPGPADRPRPVRLRLGDEVARGARADDARGVRRLLGPARLGQGGADPDPVADRHAARRRRGRPGRHRRHRLGARSRHLAGRGRDRRRLARRPPVARRSRTRPGSSGWSTGRPTPGGHVIQVRATDGTGAVQDRAADAARAGRRPRLAHDLGQRRLMTPGLGRRAFRYRVRAWLDAAISSTHPSGSWPARSASRATGRSSSRPATARAWSASCSRRSRSRSSPTASATSSPSSSAAASRRRPSTRRVAGDDTGPLDEPLNEAFRAGSLTLGWDGDDELVLVEARAQSEDGEPIDPDEDDDEDEDGPDLLRVRMTADAARSFVARATRIVARRPPAVPAVRRAARPAGPHLPAAQRPLRQLGRSDP